MTASEDSDTIKDLGKFLMEKYPSVVSVINNITSRKAGVAIGEIEHTVGGSSFIVDKIGPFEFEISANSFFQTNTKGAERLYDTVRDYARPTGSETLLDLYSGTGAISIVLSRYAKEIAGIELAESAVADAKKNCRKNKVSNCRFFQGDIRKCLPQIALRPEIVIIDPPRAGMHADVVNQVLDIGPDRIVYVSCNPATLARDIGMLKGRYQVAEVQPVDMFPHTFHIELVAKLIRRQVNGN